MIAVGDLRAPSRVIRAIEHGLGDGEALLVLLLFFSISLCRLCHPHDASSYGNSDIVRQCYLSNLFLLLKAT